MSAHPNNLIQGNLLSLSTFERIFLAWNLILLHLEFPLTHTAAGGVAAQLAAALVLQTFPHVLETFPSYATGLFTLKGEETGVRARWLCSRHTMFEFVKKGTFLKVI